jgi:hypothetical protein
MNTTTASGPTTSAPVAAQPIRKLWANWLVVWVEFVGAFGAVMLLSRAFTTQFFNWVVFGSTDSPSTFSPEALDYLRLTFVVMSAVMVGWAALLWFVARGPFRAGERWAWTALTVSIIGWYVLDSTFSLIAGFPENAILNTVFVAGSIPPLVATRPSTR